LAGCCKYGDEPSGSGATELVIIYLSLTQLASVKVRLPQYQTAAKVTYFILQKRKQPDLSVKPNILPEAGAFN
jgi:hypothetical protein